MSDLVHAIVEVAGGDVAPLPPNLARVPRQGAHLAPKPYGLEVVPARRTDSQ
jgi:hypothetical protein